MASLPALTEPFAWSQQPWGQALYCTALADVSRHVFTTRHLQLSSLAGWTSLASSLGVATGRVFRLTQVHGAAVVVISRRGRNPAWESPEGDALISDDPSLALAIRVADCSPILLADPRTGAAGAVHAGWRGTAAGIVGATVAALHDAFGTDPADLIVAIGPTIGACCYEVKPDLVDAFAAKGYPRHLIDRWFQARPARRGEPNRPALRLDIPAANRDQLILAGVPESRIHVAGLCTAEHLDLLTSFRAEQENAVRLAGAIRPGMPTS